MDFLVRKMNAHSVYFSVQGVQDLFFLTLLYIGERQIKIVWFKEWIGQQLISLKNMTLSKGPWFPSLSLRAKKVVLRSSRVAHLIQLVITNNKIQKHSNASPNTWWPSGLAHPICSAICWVELTTPNKKLILLLFPCNHSFFPRSLECILVVALKILPSSVPVGQFGASPIENWD